MNSEAETGEFPDHPELEGEIDENVLACRSSPTPT